MAEVDVLGVFTLADVRPHFIRAALHRGQHVIAEKPIAASIPEEEALLRDIEASDRLVAILDVSHQTPGAMPNEEHGPEGPPFRDCGMHYIDLARWYAKA